MLSICLWFSPSESTIAVNSASIDVSNGISPDERYVVISKGFDYNDVVPVKGIINGNFIENQNLELRIDVLNQ